MLLTARMVPPYELAQDVPSEWKSDLCPHLVAALIGGRFGGRH